jgi:hypothetical protein
LRSISVTGLTLLSDMRDYQYSRRLCDLGEEQTRSCGFKGSMVAASGEVRSPESSATSHG